MTYTDHERAYFEARVQRQANGCWHWAGPVASNGYGTANLPGGRRIGAHRMGYELANGPIPDGKHIDHACHNRDDDCPGGSTCLHRRCVNPAHLEPVEPGENSRHGKTMPALNLAKETCPRGHEYDWVDEHGWRKCTTCRNLTRKALRHRRGAKSTRAWADACAHGHPYTPENTRWDGRGYRRCRECDRSRSGQRSVA